MNKLKSTIIRLKKWINIGPIGKILIIIQTLTLLFIHFSGIHFFQLTFKDLYRIFHSYLSLWLLFATITWAIHHHKWLYRISITLLTSLWTLMIGYLITTKESIDYSVIQDNKTEAFNSEAIQVILSTLSPYPIIITIIISLIILYHNRKKQRQPLNRPIYISLITGSIYSLLLITPLIQFDETSNFIRTIIHYYQDTPIEKMQLPKDYPLLKTSKHESKPSETPDIFLIIIESFNEKMVGEKVKNKELTPFFNQLIKEGLYINRFYANSVQTCKGHFSSLFSLLPFYKGKAYKETSTTTFKSIATILKKHNYKTVYINGHHKLYFDNTETMLLKNGFEQVLSSKDLINYKTKGSWGLNDSTLYLETIKWLNETHSKENLKPIFITITPSSHHIPFKIPKSKRQIHTYPLGIKQRYHNSIRTVDDGLRTLFTQLKKHPRFKNSLIIITSDHPFPIGDHGIKFNEIGYFEESFRIPFLMIWPNHIAPKQIPGPFSQLDIAPTLLDILKINEKEHHFQGSSIIKYEKSPKPIFLIQPYNGTYLSIINNNIKFIKRLRTNEKFVYNLKTNPKENINIINQFSTKKIQEWETKLNEIILSQQLIKANKIFKN